MEPLYYIALGSAVMIAMGYVRSRYFGFLAQSPSDYSDTTNDLFDLRTHLRGPISCEGVIYGPTGRVSSRFTGEFEATWEGNTGVMTERFEYDDGSVQNRQWNLTVGNDGKIRATAADVVGEGHGQQSGPTVQLRYKIRLPESAGGYVLDTTDWMYLAPNGSIVNRSQFRKFGFKVAELVATMRRKENA